VFHTLNRKARASELRTVARELEREGFSGLAEANWEMAEWLDPTPREKPAKPPRRKAPVDGSPVSQFRLKVNHSRSRPQQFQWAIGRAA